ncbi:hypothetical protein HPB50_027549 [Hyalomma asiaticum]|uniref:Uncharacterized protein n=1 Tax=Hyalomma asiaticum TaxID=266040 RepID=A0ACB7T335_HYAAI|nr:hypothetical protein HPB50_027549 [Hyalomma asiaticum]
MRTTAQTGANCLVSAAHVYRKFVEPSSTEASPVRDARSPSLISSLQDTTSIKTTTSSLSDGSVAELSTALAESAVGDKTRRSFLPFSLTSTMGMFALVATAALAFGVLQTGSTAFQDEPGAHAGTDSEEGVVPNSPCGRFRFSFCSESKGGAYFDPMLASCLPASAQLVYVCNRSPNRFSSLRDCRRSCVEATRPHRRCMATPEFSHCDKELTRTWWFSNGTHCEEWHFPLGLCPARGSSVFPSASQCVDRCLRPRDKLQCCHRPEPHVCALGQLKYPYFAAVGYDGCFRCLEATASTLAGYQCLIGANRFDTIDACNSTCVDDSSDRK